MFKNKTLGAIALSSLGAAALTHNGATGVVMERVMGMSSMRDALNLAPMMQGQVPYDEWAVRDAATLLQTHAGKNVAGLFPEKPIPASSYAKPEIWSDWPRFEALSEELRLYAEGLDIAAVNGLDVPAPIATPVSPTDKMASMAGMDAATMPMEMPPAAFSVEELMGLVARDDQSPAMIAAPKSNGKFTGIDFEVTATHGRRFWRGRSRWYRNYCSLADRRARSSWYVDGRCPSWGLSCPVLWVYCLPH